MSADVPPVDEYNNPTDEAVIRRTEELNAVLRRRNEQIAEQTKWINELRLSVTQTEERVLEALPDSSRLGVQADQLGLTADEALKALQLGAHFLALGYSDQDFEFIRSLDMRFRRRFQDRVVS